MHKYVKVLWEDIDLSKALSDKLCILIENYVKADECITEYNNYFHSRGVDLDGIAEDYAMVYNIQIRGYTDGK